MTKATKQPAAAELNAEDAVDDLNAEGIAPAVVVTADVLNAGGESAGFECNDSGEEESADPEFVVLKGNSVRHDGEVYRENTVIPVTGKDAERLLNAGIIADVSVLRQRILLAQPSVTVTTG
ncbi:hypothetical protein ACQYRI_06145 [Salmonella enterica]